MSAEHLTAHAVHAAQAMAQQQLQQQQQQQPISRPAVRVSDVVWAPRGGRTYWPACITSIAVRNTLTCSLMWLTRLTEVVVWLSPSACAVPFHRTTKQT